MPMKRRVKQHACKFRIAIEKAKVAGEFDSYLSFSRFPRACCGDASDLLAQFFLENEINSTYVWGNRYFDDPEEGTQSHAWILVDGLIVDITGDAFHSLFDVEERNMHEFYGIENYGHMCQPRLYDLYRKIIYKRLSIMYTIGASPKY